MSFLSPLFLAGLAAAAIPVLLHLVRRATAPVVLFPSLMLLQATTRRQVRRRKLRDVLLLLLRSLALAALAVAFARPFLSTAEVALLAPAGRTTTVLLIDRSMSMQTSDWFERARREAVRLVNEAPAGDVFSVVTFDDAARQLTRLGEDRALHREAIESLTPSHRTTDIYRALRTGEEILRDARTERRRLVLLSDLQRNAWSGAVENWMLEPSVEFVPVGVAEGEPANRTIASFSIRSTRSDGGTIVQTDALVSPGERVDVSLEVDGVSVDRQTVAARYSHQARVDREGVAPGVLRLPADDLPADDRHFFVRRVVERPLLVGIDASSGPVRDGFYLQTAFDLGGDAPYRFESIGAGSVSPATLRQGRVAFLAGVPSFSPGQRSALRRHVEEGGGLVVGFGDGTPVAAADALLRALGVAGVAGVVDLRRASGGEAIIGEVDRQHPVFAVFDAAGSGAVFRPRFRTIARLVPDSATTVAARFDNGDPFLLERRVGRGVVLVYASSFGSGWTDLPVSEMYVPFLYQLAQHAMGSGDEVAPVTVGESVVLDGAPGERWDIRAPDDRSYRVDIGEGGIALFEETGLPGIYLAIRGSERRQFAVNVDPRESDLAHRDPEEAYAAVAGPARDIAGSSSNSRIAALTPQDMEGRQKLWRVVLLFGIALFALESVLAHRRRHVAGTSAPHPQAP